MVDGIDVFPAKTVFDVIRHLSGEAPIEPCFTPIQNLETDSEFLDLRMLKGRRTLKERLK